MALAVIFGLALVGCGSKQSPEAEVSTDSNEAMVTSDSSLDNEDSQLTELPDSEGNPFDEFDGAKIGEISEDGQWQTVGYIYTTDRPENTDNMRYIFVDRADRITDGVAHTVERYSVQQRIGEGETSISDDEVGAGITFETISDENKTGYEPVGTIKDGWKVESYIYTSYTPASTEDIRYIKVDERSGISGDIAYTIKCYKVMVPAD